MSLSRCLTSRSPRSWPRRQRGQDRRLARLCRGASGHDLAGSQTHTPTNATPLAMTGANSRASAQSGGCQSPNQVTPSMTTKSVRKMGVSRRPNEGEDAAKVLRSRSPSPESDPRRCVASPEGDADEVHDEEELAEAALDADAGVGARDLLPSQGRAGRQYQEARADEPEDRERRDDAAHGGIGPTVTRRSSRPACCRRRWRP